MKNLHIIPTDKPSRLSILNSGKLNFGAEIMSSSNSKPQNIYITSDEEIKKGDWLFDLDIKRIVKADNLKVLTSKAIGCWYYKKIILTTDQDLINDGVQAIDDEFLEWICKNPSCEEVEVVNGTFTVGEMSKLPLGTINLKYKIIIPKEEHPKQELPQLGTKEFNDLASALFGGKPKQIKCYCGHTTYCDCGPLEEPKQETLEEAAERYAEGKSSSSVFQEAHKKDFKEGAKWQQERSQKIVPFDAYNIEVFAIKPDENGKLLAYIGYKITNGNFHFNVVPFTEPQQERMYSEEEVIAFAQWMYDYKGDINKVEELFEQFKKK